MKRRLFFWMERLKINRNERLAVSVLMILLLSLTAANSLIPQRQPYDEAYYSRLEERFRERSERLRQEEEVLLARYYPEVQVDKPDDTYRDTVARDTTDTGSKGIGSDSVQETSRINVNTAGAAQLQTLPGIGPAYAARIIEYRQKNGPFRTYDELLNIKGIGKKRLEKLLPFIQLKGSNE